MSGIFVPVPEVRKVACALVDSGIIVGSLLLALLIRFGAQAESITGYDGLYAKAAVLTFALLLCIYYNDLYIDRAPRSRRDLFLRVSQSFVAAGILLSLVYYVLPNVTLGRGIIFIHFFVCLLGLLLWRAIYYWAIQRDSLVEKVIVLGTGEAAKEIAREMLRQRHHGYKVLGFLSEDPAEIGVRLVNPSVIGTYDDLCTLTEQRQVDMVVVALEDRRGKMPIEKLLRCKVDGVRVEEAASFYELLTGQIPIRSLRPSWLIFSQGFRKSSLLRNSRRAAEFLVALTSIVISLPVMILSALLIWLESGRPILYCQERVGQKGKHFTLYKLRTMRLNAEEQTGPVWAAADGDPRITRVGGFLRKSRIDELPQLFNVLKGHMSFVGPRPERPCFVEELEKSIPYYGERHSVKPGITGWAQVKLGYGASVEEMEVKLRYDLYYIKHMSPWLDLLIMLDTAKVILFGRGAR
jgi:sugar transferase (PEP-CTERM system associated)